jgi:hypothetical protein
LIPSSFLDRGAGEQLDQLQGGCGHLLGLQTGQMREVLGRADMAQTIQTFAELLLLRDEDCQGSCIRDSPRSQSHSKPRMVTILKV